MIRIDIVRVGPGAAQLHMTGEFMNSRRKISSIQNDELEQAGRPKNSRVESFAAALSKIGYIHKSVPYQQSMNRDSGFLRFSSVLKQFEQREREYQLALASRWCVRQSFPVQVTIIETGNFQPTKVTRCEHRRLSDDQIIRCSAGALRTAKVMVNYSD